jgi:hypothetical protein
MNALNQAIKVTESTDKMGIADCAEGIYCNTPTLGVVFVKGYKGTDGNHYYGRVVTTGVPIANPDCSVFGIWNN